MKMNSFIPLYLLASIILTACDSSNSSRIVPPAERFTFSRNNQPLKGRVKSMVQTVTESNNGDPFKETERNELWFEENGHLYKWTSYYDGDKTDLIYTSDEVGSSQIDFVSEKIEKEEKGNWTAQGSEHLLRVESYIDGKLKSTTEKRYDSVYRLLSEKETTAAGATFFGEYKYKGGLLTECSSPSRKKRYYYTNNILDSLQFFFIKGTLESTDYYNAQGDVEKEVDHTTIPVPMVRSTYQYSYDAQGNWIARTMTWPKANTVKRTTRVIRYY